MRLTKQVHACVSLDSGARHLLIDPGTFTPNAADLVAHTDTVLTTHEHPDHFDEDMLAAALADRPELTVYGPASVVERWEGKGRVANVGYLVDGTGYHPGDAYHVQIHEVMLSDVGQRAAALFLGPGMLTAVPLTIIPPGDTFDL